MSNLSYFSNDRPKMWQYEIDSLGLAGYQIDINKVLVAAARNHTPAQHPGFEEVVKLGAACLACEAANKPSLRYDIDIYYHESGETFSGPVYMTAKQANLMNLPVKEGSISMMKHIITNTEDEK